MSEGEERRWGGRLTNRPLPAHDPELERLSEALRAELSELWLARAANERRVADAFAVIAEDLRELGSPPALGVLARRAIDDEYRHAELARLVASRYAGRELAAPELLPLVVPQHETASPRHNRILHVLGHSALNETFASAYLEASLSLATAPLARAVLKSLLSDEIDHARIGWAELASLGAEERRELTRWLPGLLASNLGMWRAIPRPETNAAVLARHGMPSFAVVDRALLGAIRQLIMPGFASLGLETRALEAWAQRTLESTCTD